MDCALCRQMALRIRAEAGENSDSPAGSAASSVASSRKASVVPSVSIGKRERERERRERERKGKRNDLAFLLIVDKGRIDLMASSCGGV